MPTERSMGEAIGQFFGAQPKSRVVKRMTLEERLGADKIKELKRTEAAAVEKSKTISQESAYIGENVRPVNEAMSATDTITQTGTPDTTFLSEEEQLQLYIKNNKKDLQGLQPSTRVGIIELQRQEIQDKIRREKMRGARP